jgi:transposase InsO family protein
VLLHRRQVIGRGALSARPASELLAVGVDEAGCPPHRIAQSMGSRGDCYDNAVAESFFATLKKELIHGRSWPSKAELRTEVFEYIEVCFNRRRQHSTLGFLPPEQFETITNHHHLKERQPA